MAETKKPPTFPEYVEERWAIDRIKPYERNAKDHPDKQIRELRRSVRHYGQVWPLLVRPDGTLIAGHGRLEALKAEKFEELRVIVANGWSEDQCRAFGMIDNKLTEGSKWNDNLVLEARDLNDLGFKLHLFGFDKKLTLSAEDAADGDDDSGEIEEKFHILIECTDEKDQLAKLEQYQKDGIKCRALIA